MRLVIACLLALAPLAAACDRQSEDAPQAGGQGREGPDLSGSETLGVISVDQRGTAAPDVAIAGPDGQDITLADFEGRPVLVNLWATWCAPCIAEMPTLDALAEREEGRLEVLTVSQDLQGAEAVEPFFAEQGYRRLEPWLDPDNAMMSALGLDTLPVTILYDEAGIEQFRVYGGMDWSGDRAQRLIDGAIGG